MGRRCGYLALMSGIAGGAEVVLVPEFEANPQEIMHAFSRAWEQGKPHFIVVAAEGAQLSAEDIHKYINDTEGAFDIAPDGAGARPARREPHSLRPDTG